MASDKPIFSQTAQALTGTFKFASDPEPLRRMIRGSRRAEEIPDVEAIIRRFGRPDEVIGAETEVDAPDEPSSTGPTDGGTKP